MDRPRRRSAAALALLTLAGLGGLAWAAWVEPPIRALHWTARDADPIRAVATQPTECLRLPADPAQALKVEVGRAAFRTPLLLGGQAGRAGLACETCHRNGRNNPHFHFPGVSGPPGTADVTQSIFSSRRGDGRDNPRPIPDLSGPKAALKIDQSPSSPALPAFIRGLIVEEFDGPEPPAPVLEGLAAYVRALDPAACPPDAREPVDVAGLMADARRALAAAQAQAAIGERTSAVLLLAGARARLGLIDERLAGQEFTALRGDLRAASARLAAAQARLREDGPAPDAELAAWLDDSRRLEGRLRAAEPRSLFNPGRLRLAANRSLPD